MESVSAYPNHTFSWIELSTPDPAAASHFYSQLFGWDAIEIPLPEGGSYTMLRQDGLDVAGLGPLQESEAGHPAYWSSYISVDDAEQVAQAAAAAGATILVPAFDVMEQGRMAVLQDPTGAYISLWEAKAHIGAQLVNIPNTLCWNELVTRDATGAADFYSKVFGWDSEMGESGGGDPYITFRNQGRYAAGLLSMNEEWEGIPPHWAIYIAVEDPAAIASRAAELGGTVITPLVDVPGTGTIAILQDPQGATFNVMRLENADPMP